MLRYAMPRHDLVLPLMLMPPERYFFAAALLLPLFSTRAASAFYDATAAMRCFIYSFAYLMPSPVSSILRRAFVAATPASRCRRLSPYAVTPC